MQIPHACLYKKEIMDFIWLCIAEPIRLLQLIRGSNMLGLNSILRGETWSRMIGKKLSGNLSDYNIFLKTSVYFSV